MSDPQRAPLGGPYPQPNEATEFLLPMEDCIIKTTERKTLESRVVAGVRRALVEYEDGKHVESEAITRAAGTVLAFLDGMGS